jgi:hypothetical protein
MRPEPSDGYCGDLVPRNVASVTADLEPPRTGASAAQLLGITLAVLVGVPVLLVLGLIVTFGVQRATPEDYPRVDPRTMADRTAARSQEAYQVLGFDVVIPPGRSNSVSGSSCYPDGLESVADTPVEGAYRLAHNWGLEGVPKSEALPALRALRDHLREEGWEITHFDHAPSSSDWTLRAEQDGRRMVFDWFEDGGRFDGGAYAERAYAPSRRSADVSASSDMTAGIAAPELRPVAG